MGADGRPDPGLIRDAGLDRAGQPDVREGGAVDRAHGGALAGPSGHFRALEPVFRRFSRWSPKGLWHRIFAAMADDLEFDYLIVDSTIVRVHQHAAGDKGGLRIRPLAARVAA
jgi:hypothetical protein